MKVLHFFKTYAPDSHGGVEQFIFQLAHGSSRRGINVEVLSLSPNVDDETALFDNHITHRIRRNFEIRSTAFSFRAFPKFSALAQQADIVHLHFPWPFADMVYFATNVSKPVVLTYHSDIIRQRILLKVYGPLMRRFLNSVDRIVATSPNYLRTSETLIDFREKTKVIPIGLDRSTYPAYDPSICAKWPSLIGKRFFLFVGVLRYYKGLHILLDALRGSDYTVVIAGAGPIEAELRQHAIDLKLTDIHFVGAPTDSEKVALFNLCHAAVFPSHLRSEAFGITLLEASMYGKPLISSEVGTGTSYVNIHGETGLVVPPSDPGAVREAMRVLFDNPELAAQMGERAKQRYQKYFTASQMVDRYVRLYDELLSGRARVSVASRAQQ
ncbi:glycosyltransferase involved in cell wall biosynthesis [Bradyrhizobium japonicum]|uniref:glycosyltransferase family 4 protein n=1 Tax=Bradyrhizobium TaxID=374 RepID=UPI0004AFAC84|nr:MULTISPECIES: glycosyltransferase family 4 protein [Bradyrhizobium]MBR1034074.1 glycosyltransferase family 4 protein [Bradyrhizobium liaoningense]MDI2077981.1 glycosyltransferase family 4 protein [Bradyrhizobium sp. Mp27]